MAGRVRRFLVIAGCIIVALAVAAPVALWLLLDEQRIRLEASRYVREQTGRELRLDGPIGLSFFPWLGAELKEVSLGQPGETGGTPFARFDEVDLKVRLIPLIRGIIDVGGIRASGGIVALPGYELRDLAVTTGAFGGTQPTDLSLEFDLAPAGGRTALPVDIESRMVFDVASQRLDLSNLAGTAGDLSFKGALRGESVLDAPVLSGRVDTNTFNLRALLSHLGIAYVPADAQALTAAALSARLAKTPDRLDLRDLVFSLDGSTLKGSATAVALKEQPAAAWDATVSVDTLDVDRYLPAAAAAAAAGSTSPDDPYASLRDLVARARLDVQNLRVFGLRMTGASAALQATNGVITIAPIRAALYGGRGELSSRMSVEGRVPAYHLDGRFTGVDVQPLLTDAQQISALVGTGDLTIRLDAVTADPARLIDAARGETSLSVRDGRIEGVDFFRLLAQARAMADQLRGRPVSVQGDPANRTKFSRLSGTAVIDNGVARNDDLVLEAPDLVATGAGSIDLARETIDYRLRAKSDQAGNVTVPITVAGPFSAPTYRLEAGTLLKDAAKEELLKQLRKRGLKGLLKKP